MDPLSVTASIITLVQAAIGISKGVRVLRSFAQIPFEFSQLLNELSTLHAMIEQVEAALREWEALKPTTGYSTDFRRVDDSKVLLLKDDLVQVTKELDSLCDRLRAPRKQGGNPQHTGEQSVSKLRWQKEKGNIEKLRHKARASRELLSLCFSAFTSSQAQQHVKITLNIQEVLFTAADNILKLQNQNTKAEEGNEAILKELQGSINQLKQDLVDQNSQPSKEQTNTEINHGSVASKLFLTPKSVIQFQAVLGRKYSSNCNCNCHQVKQSYSPRWLTTLIGKLFLHYNISLTLQRPPCNKLTCTAKSPSSVRLYYAFPSWLLARAVQLDVSWSILTGPGSSLHVRVPRTLQWSSGIWRAILFGDFHWIRIHLANQSVIPTDLDEWGQSLAMVALRSGRYELAKFFVQQGCDIHLKDAFGRSTASEARVMRLTSYTNPSRVQSLQNLTEEFSLRFQVHETAESSGVHQAVLQGKDKLLSALMEADATELNRLDSFGLAPLHWTARQRHSHLARALLEAGASPDILSIAGDTPLLIAARLKDIDSVQLLLDYGVDVNSSGPYARYTAIYRAAPDVKTSRLLLSYGAHLRTKTTFGVETPLDYVAVRFPDWDKDTISRHSWSEWFHCLLSAGLDIDNQRDDGVTPIMSSLKNRNTILLDLLIDAGARLDLVDCNQWGVLHYAALSATIGSIEIFHRAKISGINPDLPNKDGRTPLGVLAARMYAPDDKLMAGECRVTMNEFWAFKSLIDDIRERNKEKRRLDATSEKRRDGVCEILADVEVISDGGDSVEGWWGGSQPSDHIGIIRAGSTSSGCDEFFDFDDE